MTGIFEAGGVIMWPLAAATVFLWFGIAFRAVSMKRGSALPVRTLLSEIIGGNKTEPHGYVYSAAVLALDLTRLNRERRGSQEELRRLLDDRLFFLEERLSRFRVLVRTIVAVAPLAGLLGTVSGMIEMFQSLGDQTFYSQSGGVANGISQALFTTQFGLVVAIPGMIAGRLLDRREQQIRADIEQIKESVITEDARGTPA